MKFSYMAVADNIKGKNVTGLIGEYDYLFKLIKDYGYDGVELLIKDPFTTNFKEIERCLKKYNLELPVICTGEMYGEDNLSFADLDINIRKEAIRRTKETMKIAGEFNAHVNVGRLRGRFEEGVKREDTIKWAKEGFLESAISNRSVNLLLEPINYKVSNFILTTIDGVNFIKDLNEPNIRLMLDYIHMMIENENLEKSIRASKNYIDHVHVCDSDRLPLGMGNYKLDDFARILLKVGYDDYISIEAFDTEDYVANVNGSILELKRVFNR